MVSFQPAALPSPRPLPDYSSKKRKSEDLSLPSDHHHHHQKSESFFQKRSKPESGTSMGVQLETSPLPFEWQRCLDIQSGELHFYNVKTEKITFDDPRMRSPRSPVGGHMSLELQLNLPCDSDHDQAIPPTKHNFKLVSPSDQQRSFPSWLAVEEEQQQEMMATVCMKCHMLVMLCKASPACPNCKFMHPVDQPPANLFKPSCLTLLC